MKQKNFLAKRKHHRKRKRAKTQLKAFEAGEVKYGELPSLAKKFVARKRRVAARPAAA